LGRFGLSGNMTASIFTLVDLPPGRTLPLSVLFIALGHKNPYKTKVQGLRYKVWGLP